MTSNQMLARQRQARILEEVRRLGGVRVSSLTHLLGVSDMTVRRDLEALAERGLIEKVHGGATAVPEHSTDEPGFEAKSYRQQAEKEAIAAAAAELVEPGGAIGITAGTTTWAFAAHLAHVPGLTVVTNSIPVAERLHLAARGDQTVVLTGGVRTPSDALVGPVAVNTISSLHLDMVFMGVHGMHEGGGFTTPNLVEADTNRAFISAARTLAVLADHTKWGVIGLSSIAALDQATVLITDDGISTAAADSLRSQIADVRLASSQRTGQEAMG